MILCIGTTPAVQRVMLLPELRIDDVNRARCVLEGAAGKAVNVAKVLSRLGDRVSVAGFLGGDRGKFLGQLLEQGGVSNHFIWVENETRECLTVIDEAGSTQTELVEESKPVTEHEASQLINLLCRQVPRATAVIMSGTICPGMADSLYRDITEMSNASGLLSVIDAKGSALTKALPAHPGLVKPNRAELAATVGRSVDSEAECLHAMKDILDRGASRIVVTAGKRPILAMDENHSWRISNPSVQVKNPIGSGDSFTAGVTSRLVKGNDLGEACRWGAACGAANALSWMPGDLELTQVTELLPLVAIEKLAPV